MSTSIEPSAQRLYLVRHGEAKPKDEDPERGLTDGGRADVSTMAAWAAAAGIRVDEIRHSGKQRSKETAEILAEHLGTHAHAVSGLAPKGDVAEIARAINAERCVVMLVGHLPFLERLAAFLTVDNAENSVISFDAAALLELTRTDDEWTATCLMQPRLIPGR